MATAPPDGPAPSEITGLVLAGGRGRRMGGQDKGLVLWQGQALVDHALERLRHQTGSQLISANRHLDDYATRGAPVVVDESESFDGPLAGILGGLRAARTPWVAVVPCDTPRLPADLVTRLAAGLRGASAAVVERRRRDGSTRIEPLCCLLARALQEDLGAWLGTGERRVQPWLLRHARRVPFDRDTDDDAAFANFNTASELAS